MTATQLQHVIIGTAGHIDHGKTRLVGRLSNIDTDRLPEEKARGISIDLGFAHWEAGGFQFGIVDVPGHERFVKNMVAGATGVNLALLVVAADDGVMPQTHEHLDIMDLLGVQTGVVAITKTDMVDPDFVELVTEEVRETTIGTFLEGCPVIPVSSETGAGIDELREALAASACSVDWDQPQRLFRMPIDRVFSLEGHGTVVTGTVISGQVAQGQTLELLPRCLSVRVRSVENHKSLAAESGARQRTALNLAGIKAEEIQRGNELAVPGYLQPARRLLVQLKSLARTAKSIKHRQQFQLYLGTSETPARVILKGQQLEPGGSCYAELRLDRPVVAEYGQRFILRRLSPALTVAGGKVLDPCVEPHRRIKRLQEVGRQLDQPCVADRLSALFSQQDVVDDSAMWASWRAGAEPDCVKATIEILRARGDLLCVGNPERPLWVHRLRLQALQESVLKRIHAELSRHQPCRALPRATLLTTCRKLTRPGLLDVVFDLLLKEGRLVKVGPHIGPSDAQVQLTKKQVEARARILERITAGELAPPTLKELSAELGQPLSQLELLAQICVEDGLLIRVTSGMYFTPNALEQARNICRDVFKERHPAGGATMSQLRDSWGVTRKFAVPLCEFFDAEKVTIRDGDLRRAGPRLQEFTIV